MTRTQHCLSCGKYVRIAYFSDGSIHCEKCGAEVDADYTDREE
jgi:transposase